MELFGIFQTAPRVRKLVTSGDVQTSLETFLTTQLNDFMNHDEAHDFDGQYKPEDNEALSIKNFVDIDDLVGTAKAPDDCVQWGPNSDTASDNLKALFFYTINDGRYNIGIQNFDRRQVISNKFTISWSRDSFHKLESDALSIDTKLCAVLQEQEDGTNTLYFKSLSNVRRIFDMSEYYHLATIDEVNSFFQSDIFSAYDNEWLESNNDDTIRKTVTFISKQGILDQVGVPEITTYAKSVNFDIDTVDDAGIQKIVFPKEKKKLKALLRFLDEDIYMSPFTKQRYMSNSKRVI